MSDRVRYVIERFPDLAPIIKQYSADSRFFASLCQDYGEAIEVLRRWEGMETSPASGGANSCRELIAELEQEILVELQHRIDGG